MSDHHEVPVDTLLRISQRIKNSFFSLDNLYFLLLLSLCTVTIYARKNMYLTTSTRIELTIAFTPDLINFLVKSNNITAASAELLYQQYEKKFDELPMILQAYIYSSQVLYSGVCSKEDHNKCAIM